MGCAVSTPRTAPSAGGPPSPPAAHRRDGPSAGGALPLAGGVAAADAAGGDAAGDGGGAADGDLEARLEALMSPIPDGRRGGAKGARGRVDGLFGGGGSTSGTGGPTPGGAIGTSVSASSASSAPGGGASSQPSAAGQQAQQHPPDDARRRAMIDELLFPVDATPVSLDLDGPPRSRTPAAAGAAAPADTPLHDTTRSAPSKTAAKPASAAKTRAGLAGAFGAAATPAAAAAKTPAPATEPGATAAADDAEAKTVTLRVSRLRPYSGGGGNVELSVAATAAVSDAPSSPAAAFGAGKSAATATAGGGSPASPVGSGGATSGRNNLAALFSPGADAAPSAAPVTAATSKPAPTPSPSAATAAATVRQQPQRMSTGGGKSSASAGTGRPPIPSLSLVNRGAAPSAAAPARTASGKRLTPTASSAAAARRGASAHSGPAPEASGGGDDDSDAAEASVPVGHVVTTGREPAAAAADAPTAAAPGASAGIERAVTGGVAALVVPTSPLLAGSNGIANAVSEPLPAVRALTAPADTNGGAHGAAGKASGGGGGASGNWHGPGLVNRRLGVVIGSAIAQGRRGAQEDRLFATAHAGEAASASASAPLLPAVSSAGSLLSRHSSAFGPAAVAAVAGAPQACDANPDAADLVFAAVFDGHGGDALAEWLRQRLCGEVVAALREHRRAAAAAEAASVAAAAARASDRRDVTSGTRPPAASTDSELDYAVGGGDAVSPRRSEGVGSPARELDDSSGVAPAPATPVVFGHGDGDRPSGATPPGTSTSTPPPRPASLRHLHSLQQRLSRSGSSLSAACVVASPPTPGATPGDAAAVSDARAPSPVPFSPETPSLPSPAQLPRSPPSGVASPLSPTPPASMIATRYTPSDPDWRRLLSGVISRLDGAALDEADAGRLPRDAGACAVAALLYGDALVIANVGDCEAWLCRGGRPYELTCPHKAERDTEVCRVTHTGGQLSAWGGGGLRVAGALRVSRSIGMAFLKRPSYTGLIAEPFVRVARLRPLPTSTGATATTAPVAAVDEFVVLGSDGLWDVFPSRQDLLNRVKRALRATGSADGAAAAVVGEAVRDRRAPDNVSLVIILLNQFGVSTATAGAGGGGLGYASRAAARKLVSRPRPELPVLPPHVQAAHLAVAAANAEAAAAVAAAGGPADGGGAGDGIEGGGGGGGGDDRPSAPPSRQASGRLSARAGSAAGQVPPSMSSGSLSAAAGDGGRPRLPSVSAAPAAVPPSSSGVSLAALMSVPSLPPIRWPSSSTAGGGQHAGGSRGGSRAASPSPSPLASARGGGGATPRRAAAAPQPAPGPDPAPQPAPAPVPPSSSISTAANSVDPGSSNISNYHGGAPPIVSADATAAATAPAEEATVAATVAPASPDGPAATDDTTAAEDEAAALRAAVVVRDEEGESLDDGDDF